MNWADLCRELELTPIPGGFFDAPHRAVGQAGDFFALFGITPRVGEDTSTVTLECSTLLPSPRKHPVKRAVYAVTGAPPFRGQGETDVTAGGFFSGIPRRLVRVVRAVQMQWDRLPDPLPMDWALDGIATFKMFPEQVIREARRQWPSEWDLAVVQDSPRTIVTEGRATVYDGHRVWWASVSYLAERADPRGVELLVDGLEDADGDPRVDRYLDAFLASRDEDDARWCVPLLSTFQAANSRRFEKVTRFLERVGLGEVVLLFRGAMRADPEAVQAIRMSAYRKELVQALLSVVENGLLFEVARAGWALAQLGEASVLPLLPDLEFASPDEETARLLKEARETLEQIDSLPRPADQRESTLPRSAKGSPDENRLPRTAEEPED